MRRHSLIKGNIMYAHNLISQIVVPLRTSDTGDTALELMNEHHLSFFPIVNNKQLLGYISEDDILMHDSKEAIGTYKLSHANLNVKADDHIFDVIKLMGEQNIGSVPVVDLKNEYLGMILEKDLTQFFAKTASFTEPGSLIVLSIPRRDYSLVKITQIIESEDALILSSFVTSDLSSGLVDLTLKINRQDISRIVASLQRYSFNIKATFNEEEFGSKLKDNFDALMSYLNV